MTRRSASGVLTFARPLLLLLLLALRLPSVVEPAGGDQGLYAYEGQRILAGDVLYRDLWDQKPPGIGFLYATLLRIWPHESVVALADLIAAAVVAWLLVVLGRRRFSENVGYGAASLFLLFGDPSLQRLSGIYVRGQCEPFIALAITAGLVGIASPRRRTWHLVLAGVSLAAAFWLKYNAITYALPLALAIWAWNPAPHRDRSGTFADLMWIATGFGILTIALLAYLGLNGALQDWRLATIDYNLRYSNETYASGASVVSYVLSFPIVRAKADMLWFLGGAGALSLIWEARRGVDSSRSARVLLAWLVAATLSIVVNGQRDLPNYFVQANPALAIAASAGLAAVFVRRTWVRYAAAGVILAGIWRVGVEVPTAGFRWGGLPGLLENVHYDLSYVHGEIDRATYLRRYRGQKHDALEIDDLARYVREKTTVADPIFVFGFSGGSVCWKSQRVSSSRFFWSRPIIIEFAANRPDYGSAGLLADLQRRPPALVALQKEQWDSHGFFMRSTPLRSWLESGYVLDRDTSMFAVWRQKPRSE